MPAYYSEFDPKAAAWLRELIKRGLIADGVVDERDLWDVAPADLRDFTQCHFFAGIGVWSYALRQAGWADDRPVWTGSCPCQPFSSAGKGAGFADERHLWPAWHYLIRELRPGTIFGEQVATNSGLGWLDLVHSDLEEAGYACAAVDLCAAGVGAPQIRQRLFFVAHTDSERLDGKYSLLQRGQQAKDSLEVTGRSAGARAWAKGEWSTGADGQRRWIEPGIEPLANGVTKRMELLRGYGAALNAEVAATFIKTYLSAAE